VAGDNIGKNSHIKVRLTAIHYGARDIYLYVFSPLDGGVLPGAEAGAHISILLPSGIERQYSLIHAGEKMATYTIGVKLDAQSRGGSSYIHENFKVGMIMEITPPINHFELKKDAAHTVLIAGGIGITPIYCMMEQLEDLNTTWELHYSCRSREDALFLSLFKHNKNVHLYFDDERKGDFLPLQEIVNSAPAEAHFYCCGPAPMLNAFEKTVVNYPKPQVHVEYFSSKEDAALTGGYVVELAVSGIKVDVQPGISILHTLLEHGVEVPFSCEQGACGMCEVDVVEGEPDHRDSVLTEKERTSNESMMICCSGCKGDRLVLDL